MPSETLRNEEFFSKLTELFDYRRGKSHGKIYLTQKRMSHGQEESLSAPPAESNNPPFPDLAPAKPLPILVRATNGKSKARRSDKVKLSTLVDAAGLDAFYARYAEVCKAGMSALKPRDRSRKKAKAKKKKVTTTPGTGPA